MSKTKKKHKRKVRAERKSTAQARLGAGEAYTTLCSTTYTRVMHNPGPQAVQ